MSTIVDARFAGGHIAVEHDNEYTGDGRDGVILTLPGHSIWLFAHEARKLAAVLTKEANA